jgi:hypothetical protein
MLIDSNYRWPFLGLFTDHRIALWFDGRLHLETGTVHGKGGDNGRHGCLTARIY